MREFDIPICINDMDNKYFGTHSEANLWAAFVGECMAATKYSYYASLAKKAGYEVLAELFQKTAGNECEHAKIWYKELKQLPKTIEECLSDAIKGELHEWSLVYRNMAMEAIEDGFDDLACTFSRIADIEKKHADHFQLALSKLDLGTYYRNTGLVIWECRNCGYRVVSDKAPSECPVCNHPQGFFQHIEL